MYNAILKQGREYCSLDRRWKSKCFEGVMLRSLRAIVPVSPGLNWPEGSSTCMTLISLRASDRDAPSCLGCVAV